MGTAQASSCSAAHTGTVHKSGVWYLRGIWIYAAKRTTNHGRDHPFVACQVMSQKYGILVYLAEPRAQFEQSLVRTSDMPKTKMLSFLLGSNPGHYTTTQPASRLLPCTPAPFLSFSASILLRKRTIDARGVRGIWIYAAKRTTNHGRDHPFVVC